MLMTNRVISWRCPSRHGVGFVRGDFEIMGSIFAGYAAGILGILSFLVLISALAR